jgi:hypothetical protein
MSGDLVKGPGDKPTKRYEPVEPEEEPQKPEEPDWGSPDSADH